MHGAAEHRGDSRSHHLFQSAVISHSTLVRSHTDREGGRCVLLVSQGSIDMTFAGMNVRKRE